MKASDSCKIQVILDVKRLLQIRPGGKLDVVSVAGFGLRIIYLLLK
jgi:hypothetical protein